MENKSNIMQSKLSKITIPQPFGMTIRESSKNTKSSTQSKLHNIPTDDIECLKKFRANLVPPKTFLPLYEEMVNVEELKRHARNRMRGDAAAKHFPFSFADGINKNRRRSRSASEIPPASDDENIGPSVPNRRPNFSKKTFAEFMAENELLREVRIKTRAEQLLKQSVLPQSIKESQDRWLIKKRLVLSKQKAHCTPTRPMKGIYTVKVPSKAETHEGHPQVYTTPKLKPQTTTSNEVLISTEINPTKRRSKSLSDLRDAAGFLFMPRMNRAAKMRNETKRTSNERNKHIHGEDQSKDGWGLKNAILRSTLAYPNSSQEEKVGNLRKANRIQHLAYLEDMKQMVTRVKLQPLLIERQLQINSTNNVENKFKKCLTKHGLDSKFVIEKSEKRNAKNPPESPKLSKRDDSCDDHSFESMSEDESNSTDSDSKEHLSKTVSESAESGDDNSSNSSQEIEKIPEHDCD